LSCPPPPPSPKHYFCTPRVFKETGHPVCHNGTGTFYIANRPGLRFVHLGSGPPPYLFPPGRFSGEISFLESDFFWLTTPLEMGSASPSTDPGSPIRDPISSHWSGPVHVPFGATFSNSILCKGCTSSVNGLVKGV